MRANRIIATVFAGLVIASGCQKRLTITPLPAAAPAPDPATAALDDANRSFNAGSYDEAAHAYENYLRRGSAGPRTDEALFHLGLAYALRASADWQSAVGAFRQIMEDFPNSPFRVPASLIVFLHSELDQASANIQQREIRIRQLTTELDRLKKIDADRRRRP
jgi:outer membrane protein assembly factor BamD (BamD/ComL family)